MFFPIQAHVVEGDAHEFLDAVGLARADYVIISLVLLQHQPHGPDIIAGKSPVALGLQVAQPQLLVQPQLDPSDAMSDFPSDELQAAPRRFMIEQDARAGE